MLLIVLSDCFSFQHHSAVNEPCYVLVVSTRGNPSRQISRYCKVKAVFNNSRRAVGTALRRHAQDTAVSYVRVLEATEGQEEKKRRALVGTGTIGRSTQGVGTVR